MAEPVQQRARGWYRRSLLVALVAVLAVPAVDGALWLGRAGDVGVLRPSSPTPSRQVQNGSAPVPSSAAVRDLLGRRSAAVTSRDRARWLATVDTRVPGLDRTQGDLFDRLALLRPASWAYTLLTPDVVLPTARQAALGASAFLAHVRLAYRLAPGGAEIERDQHLTLVWRGRWLVGGDDGPQQRDLWDLGPISVSRSSRSVVVAARPAPVPAGRTAREADAAAQRVDAVWGTAWPRTVVVMIPSSMADMATLLDRKTPGGLDRLAAVTTGELRTSGTGRVAGGRTTGDRVVVNPAAFPGLTSVGREVVLTHEFTHVATRRSVAVAPPVWVDEGFADYVAYLGTPLGARDVAGDLLSSPKAVAALRDLPRDQDFDPADGPVGTAYAQAWLAMRFVAQEAGTAGVVDFYRIATGLTPLHTWPVHTPVRPSLTPRTPLEHACVEVLGYVERSFVRRWLVYVREQATAA